MTFNTFRCLDSSSTESKIKTMPSAYSSIGMTTDAMHAPVPPNLLI